MEKGVKKIKYVKGIIYPHMSVPDIRLTIKPNQEVHFKIAEWFAGTSAADKAKKISWIKQSNNRQTVISKEVLSPTEAHKFKLTKKHCGYYYYVKASLSGNRDFKNKTGLYVKGWCEPKIVSSKWCTKNDGIDERSREYSFGENVYLGLETEGVNGSLVTVELYRLNNEVTLDKITQWITNKKYDPTKDDIVAKIYEKKAEVIDGEINVDFIIQPSWKKGESGNRFYVKIKNGKNYIPDYHGDYIHARYLKVKNETVPIKRNTTDLNNNAPVKIGEPDKNRKNAHLCKFEQINVQDNGETFSVYNEGRTLLKKVSSETQSVNYRVYFNYDKSTIRPDAKETLKYLLDFLLYNQHLDMMLSGHADDRGTLDYNQALSERRAQAVRDFFTNGGLDRNRIKTRGFGEVNPLAAGKTEEAYRKNRRVEIDFRYLEYNQDAIVYETVAGSSDVPRNITVNILNRSDKGCFRKEKHKKNEVIVNHRDVSKETKQGSSISYPIFAKQRGFPDSYLFMLGRFLNPYATIYYPFGFHINSCAYYANKSKATLEVRTYPDVVWIGHFQYTSTEKVMSYYFHQKNFELEQGISDVVDTITNSTLFKITKILPSQWIMEKVVLAYIKKEANSYFYGIHTIHNRDVEKTTGALSLVGKETNLIRQTKYTKYLAAAVIYGFVVVGILIDLLMIYLTRGKNLTGRIAKISKYVKGADKLLKTLKDEGVEIIPPSIAINAGMYYKKQKNGRLALVYEANLSAKPLVEVDFKREFDLLDLLKKGIENIQKARHPNDKKAKDKLEKNKKNNKKIIEYFESISKNIKIRGTFDAIGKIQFDKNVQYNLLTNTHSFIDKLGNLSQTAQNEVTITDQINFNAKIAGKFSKEFTFLTFRHKVEGNIDVEMQGGSGVKLRYGVDTGNNSNRNNNAQKAKGMYVTSSLYCSGVEGTYSGSLKAKGPLGLYEYETNEGKPTPFTLVEPFEVELYEIQLFKS